MGKVNPFDYFDGIYCINLERRVDRWTQCKKEFDKIGISDRVERFNAFDNKSNPKKGCYDSHLSVIKLAFEKKLKNVLIFEDDVAFLKTYDEKKLKKALSVLDKEEWEFFYLGGLERRMKPRPLYNNLKKKWSGEFNDKFNYLMECRSVGWAQSFAVNSSVFEKIVNDYNNNVWKELVKNHDSHLDRYYQNVLKPKTFVSVPIMTTQYNTVSDLSRTRTNRSLRLSTNDKSILNKTKKNPFDFFDGIYCINLDEREDRWNHSCKQFEKLGVKERVKRFSAIKPTYDSRWDRPVWWSGGKRKYPRLGAVGCAESHKEIIKLSMEQNFSNVLVFEDDFDVCDNWDKNLESALHDLKNLPWDLFYLGYHLHRADNMIRPDWKNLSRIISKRNRGIHRTLSLAYNQKSFNFLLNNINSFDFKRFGRNGHVDKFYSRSSKLKKFFVNPEVVKPNENFKSDIA